MSTRRASSSSSGLKYCTRKEDPKNDLLPVHGRERAGYRLRTGACKYPTKRSFVLEVRGLLACGPGEGVTECPTHLRLSSKRPGPFQECGNRILAHLEALRHVVVFAHTFSGTMLGLLRIRRCAISDAPAPLATRGRLAHRSLMLLVTLKNVRLSDFCAPVCALTPPIGPSFMRFYGVVRDFRGGPEVVVPVGLGGVGCESVRFEVSNSRFVLPCPALPRTPFTVKAPD